MPRSPSTISYTAEYIHNLINNRSISLPSYNHITNNIFNTSQQSESNYIYQNSYKPQKYNFHRIQNEEDLYLGVELEIDQGGRSNNNAKMIIDFIGDKNAYCKDDGSLTSGIEIVTHPCTYEYHLTLPYEELFEKLIKLNYKSHDTTSCGLHVHFNKNYFGENKLIQDLCFAKLLYLFEKFWDKIVLIARRGSSYYATRYGINQNDSLLDLYAKSKNAVNKYKVINLNNKDTCEIRIFKGTLNYNTFISTLEFVRTIIPIVKDLDIYKIQDITWDEIEINFSEELKEYIKDRENRKNQSQHEINNNNNNEPIYQPCVRGGRSNSIIIDSLYGFQRDQLQNYQREYMCNWGDSLLSIDLASDRVSEELTDIQREEREIQRLNREIRNARNPLQQNQLRRELQQHNANLGRLRRQRGR